MQELPTLDCAETWAKVLENRGVDEGARVDWVTLYAAPSPKGKEEALSIVHKILKKDSGGYGVDKPSAFAASGVRNAWHKLRDDARKGRSKGQ